MKLKFRISLKTRAVCRLIKMSAMSAALAGCATIYGWNIHAPGMLSANYAQAIKPMPARVGLYLEPEVYTFKSKNKGGWAADPQTYFIGEAYAPMVIEGFQSAFDEFILLEIEPTKDILSQYAIPYLAMVRMKDFGNRVTLKGQAVVIETETAVLDTQLNLLSKFESSGSSDAKKVFAKAGGPEVNLNAAIENNVLAIVQYLQDSIRSGSWN